MPGDDAPVDLRLLPGRAVATSDGRLELGGIDVAALADEYGTPLYVYDEDELRDRCRAYRDTFATEDGRANVSYAAKAFLCGAMARVVDDEGLELEVASGGELHVALHAGFPPARMVLHGNNKSDAELRAALGGGVGRVVVDGFDELDRIEQLVTDGLPRPRVLLRVTPGVEAHTHEHIATGADDSKFGFSVVSGAALDAARRAAASDAFDFLGFHCHIGSQILALDAFDDAAAVMARLAADAVAATGHPVEELNLGGGLGVAYVADDLAELPGIATFGAAVRAAHDRVCKAAGLDPVPRLTVEAGRSIVATAGLTLYRVGAVKVVPGHRTYVAVDGGMSDNPRPITYGARYEAFLPARVTSPRTLTATVAGKHCEQGDLLVTDGRLPADVAVGDVLAVPVTGAYAASMASNYNLLTRPAVVFVRGGEARVVVRRETLDDLVSRDVDALGKTGA